MVCFTYQVGQVMSGGGSFLLINWKGWLVDGGHFYLSGGSNGDRGGWFYLSGELSDFRSGFVSLYKVGVTIVDGKLYLSGGSNDDRDSSFLCMRWE